MLRTRVRVKKCEAGEPGCSPCSAGQPLRACEESYVHQRWRSTVAKEGNGEGYTHMYGLFPIISRLTH